MDQFADISTSLKDRILLILESNHIGRQRAIKAKDLARKVGEPERAVRAAISEMRKDGRLILSAVQRPYGYFMASNHDEWREFRNGNLRPRALDILETDRAMNKAAQERWSDTNREQRDEVVQLTMLAPLPEMVA